MQHPRVHLIAASPSLHKFFIVEQVVAYTYMLYLEPEEIELSHAAHVIRAPPNTDNANAMKNATENSQEKCARAYRAKRAPQVSAEVRDKSLPEISAELAARRALWSSLLELEPSSPLPAPALSHPPSSAP